MLIMSILVLGTHALIEFTVPSNLASKYLYSDSKLVREIDLHEIKEFAPANINKKTLKRPTIIVFYAPWCPHCRHFVPKYNEIAAKFEDPGSLNLFQLPEHSKNVQFLAVNCVDQKEACNYISLCDSKRKLSKEEKDNTHSYSQDGCGYPSILAFNFEKDSKSVQEWFGHHITHNPELLEKYLVAYSERPLEQQSPHSSAQRSAELKELASFLTATTKSLARSGGSRIDDSDRAPVRRLREGLASINYMLLVTIPSGTDNFKSDDFRGMIEAVDQFLGVMVRLLPWEFTSSFLGLLRETVGWDGKTRYIRLQDWIKPLVVAVQKGQKTTDLISILNPDAAPVELSALGPDDAATLFGTLWRDKIAQILDIDPDKIHWELCGQVANGHGGVSGGLSSDIDTRTEGHTCGLWLLFHYMTIASEMSTLPNPDRNFTVAFLQQRHAVGAVDVMEAIHVFMRHLFSCSECQGHFLKAYDAKTHGRGLVTTQGDYVPLQLWLLKFHNVVTLRILDGVVNPVLADKLAETNTSELSDGSYSDALLKHYATVLFPTKSQCRGPCVQVKLKEESTGAVSTHKRDLSAHMSIVVDSTAALSTLRNLYWHSDWGTRQQWGLGPPPLYIPNSDMTAESGSSSHFRGSTGGGGPTDGMPLTIFLFVCCVLLVVSLAGWSIIKCYYSRTSGSMVAPSADQKRIIYKWLTFANKGNDRDKSLGPDSD